jgi:hypothetical protein
MVELYLHSPIRIRGVVLNYLSTGATLSFYMKNQSHAHWVLLYEYGSLPLHFP